MKFRYTVAFLAALCGCIWTLFADPGTAFQTGKTEFEKQNFRDALTHFEQGIRELSPPADRQELPEVWRMAVRSMAQMGLFSRYDALRSALFAQSPSPAVLLAVAENPPPAYGTREEGKFLRGKRPLHGMMESCAEADRMALLREFDRALSRMQNSTPSPEYGDFFIAFARLLQGEESFDDQPWLKYLKKTDWNAPVQEKPLLHRPMPRPAPRSAEGEDAVFFPLPASWETAANDGERCRWLLERACAGANAKGMAALLDFLRETYRFVPGDYPENAEESAKIAAIPDTETQTFFNGTLRRIILPDFSNPILLAQRFLNDHPDAEEVASRLADLRMERFQYRQAEEILKLFAGKSQKFQRRLNNLTKPGILVSPLPPFSPETEQELSFRSRNGAEIRVEIRRIDLEKVLAIQKDLMESPDSPLPSYTLKNLSQLLSKLRTVPVLNPSLSGPIFHRTIAVSDPSDHYWHDGKMPLPKLGGGLYLVTVQNGDQSQDTVLTITSRSLLYFPTQQGGEYFVLRASDGAPIPHAEIIRYAMTQESLKQQPGQGRRFRLMQEQQTLQTNGQGRCEAPDPGKFRRFLVIAPAPEGGFAWLEHGNSRIVQEDPPQIRLWTAFDSPVYRPGSVAHFESYIRTAGKPESLWAGKKIRAVITDPRGNPVQDLTYDTSDFASFDGKCPLGEDAASGIYRIDFRSGTESVGSAQFRVEQFKTPEYRITVQMPPAEQFAGSSAEIFCEYFSGPPAAGAKIFWKLTRRESAMPFCPKPFAGMPEEGIASGNGIADDKGKLTISLPKDLTPSRYGNVYTLTAEVQDASLRTESASASREIPPADAIFQLTCSTDRGFGTAGDPLSLSIQASTPDGAPAPGKGEWILTPAKWDNGELEPSGDALVTVPFAITDRQEITFPVTIRRAGVYLAVIRFTPERGKLQETRLPIYICGGSSRASLGSPQPLEVFSDRKTYAPGDTAKLLIVSHQSSGSLLCRIRPHAQEDWRQITLQNHWALLEIPIRAEDHPNFSVQLILNTADRSWGIFHDLSVPYTGKKLQVSAAVQPQKIQPGNTASLKIRVTDAEGNGISGGSVTVAVYDQALESIAPHEIPEIFPFFWGWHRNIYFPWQSSAGDLPAHPAGAAVNRKLQTAATADAVAESAAPMPFAAGARGGAAPQIQVRQEFLDNILWIARKKLDVRGEITLPVTVPDNLTTWQIRVWALAAEGKVGETKADLTVHQDFTARLELPRFLMIGDAVEIPALLQNDHNSPRTVTAELLQDDRSLGTQTATLAAGGHQAFRWRISAETPGNHTFLFRAAANDGARDAVARALPVMPWGHRIVRYTTGTVTPDQDLLTLPLAIPSTAAPGTAALTVQVTPSCAAAMLSILPWLWQEDSDNLFSRVDRILPPMAAWEALQQTGLQMQSLPAARKLPGATSLSPLADPAAFRQKAENSIREIASLQNPDGGWGWFAGGKCRSSADVTIRALKALHQAKRLGFPVEDAVLSRGIAFLKQTAETRDLRYRKQEDVIDNLSALLLAELSNYSIFLPGYLDAVYLSRERLSPLGLTLLAQTLHAAGDTQKLQTVLENLRQYLKMDPSNQTAHLRVPQTRFWQWDMRSLETNAAYLTLRQTLDPAHPELPLLAKYLTENLLGDPRNHSHRALAAGVESLAQYLKVSGELQHPMVIRIGWDGKEIGTRVFTPEALAHFDGTIAIPHALLTPGEHRLTIRREGAGRVYAGALLQYYETADVIPQTGNDLRITRRYRLLDPVTRQPLRELQNGDPLSPGALVETELTLNAKNDYHYLAIRDPRPAGMEPEERRSGHLSGSGIYREIRHQETRFYFQDLPGGSASLRYRLRVHLPGQFRIPPATAQALYAPELHGNSASGAVTVRMP